MLPEFSVETGIAIGASVGRQCLEDEVPRREANAWRIAGLQRQEGLKRIDEAIEKLVGGGVLVWNLRQNTGVLSPAKKKEAGPLPLRLLCSLQL